MNPHDALVAQLSSPADAGRVEAAISWYADQGNTLLDAYTAGSLGPQERPGDDDTHDQGDDLPEKSGGF